ncbi:MAG: hypothetical protein ABL927_01490 [Bdellovibrionales bacterium]
MENISSYIFRAKSSKSALRIEVGNFIDDFRRSKDLSAIKNQKLKGHTAALFAAIAHHLCIELGLKVPNWLRQPKQIKEPYFVSDLQNSRLLALRDSPYAFRARNIFVPFNYLNRA